MRPKIRHIAAVTRNPYKLAEFYKKVFDMDIVLSGKTATGYDYAMVSDGYLTMALLPHCLTAEMAVGINHFGFQIDDQAEIEERLVATGAEAPAQRPSDRPYAEKRACDPDGNQFDLSVHGFDRSEAKIVSERQKEFVGDRRMIETAS
jgi:catechol 2,3-dioxygenase-like lactoylglutathione lyase family enzyme